jgi:hypothetical protein
MSVPNQLSVVIPQAVMDDVLRQLKDIKALLAPHLQGLTAQERRELFKMGDKTVATVSKVKSYLETNPEFIPAYLDVPEFLKDENVVV